MTTMFQTLPCRRWARFCGAHGRALALALGRVVLAALLVVVAGCHQAESPSAPRGPTRSGGQPAAGGDATDSLLQARSIQVQDGDSFIVRTINGSRRTIRLSGIDAPERTQAWANQSRQNLRRLLEDRELRVQVVKTDQYGRAIAQVFVAGDGAPGAPVDIGLAQLESGLAWFYRRFQSDLPTASRERYAEAERSARHHGKGLWQMKDPEPPWDFRRRQHPTDRATGP